jgi:hypothetical protein
MKTIADEGNAPENPPDYTMDSKPGAVLVSHSDIVNLAHQLWEQRGCPEGSPDDDWFEAKQRLACP